MGFTEKVNQMMQAKHNVLSDVSKNRQRSTQMLGGSLENLASTFMELNKLNQQEEEAGKQREHEQELVGLRGEEQRETQEAASDYRLANKKEFAQFQKDLEGEDYPIEWNSFGEPFRAENPSQLKAELARLNSLTRDKVTRLRDALEGSGETSLNGLLEKYYHPFRESTSVDINWTPSAWDQQKKSQVRDLFRQYLNRFPGLDQRTKDWLIGYYEDSVGYSPEEGGDISEGGDEPGLWSRAGEFLKGLGDVGQEGFGDDDFRPRSSGDSAGAEEGGGQEEGEATQGGGVDTARMDEGDMRGLVEQLVATLSDEDMRSWEERTVKNADAALNKGAGVSELQALIEPLLALAERYGTEEPPKTGPSEGYY